MISLWLEFKGHQIMNREVTFLQTWSLALLSGALKTTLGATLLGFFVMGISLVIKRFRNRSIAFYMTLWFMGAILFLLAMLMLVLWAP